MKKVLEDERDVGVGELGGRLEAQIEEPVVGAVLGECLELDQQRRHEIERDADVRELPEQRHHAVIVLEGMEPDPRQDVLVGDEVFVERLVHVPEDGDLCHRCYSLA